MKNRICMLLVIAFIAFSSQAQEEKEETTTGTKSLQSLFEKPLSPPKGVTVFVAKEIVTMSPTLKSATAIAVRDGRIIDVGDKETLLAKFKSEKNVEFDDTYKDKVLTPGFIDPHLHFWLFAMVSNAHFITPADWQLPWGDVKGVVGQKEYAARLKEIESNLETPDELLLTWGYHAAFHGELTRAMLDEISSKRPIVIWHRSCHEFYFNTKSLEMMGLKESDWQGKGQSSEMASWEEGHVWEVGMYLVMKQLFPIIASPELFEKGLKRTSEYVHAGGITTAADPGVQGSKDMIKQMIRVIEDGTMAFDYYMIPAGNTFYDTNGKDADLAVTQAKEMVKELNGEKVKWETGQVKLFTDGAVFSQLMQMKYGYLDGHKGEWIQKPEDFANCAWAFWKNDYQIIIHQNGDLGMEVCINTLESMMDRYPRHDHRYRMDHFAFSEVQQVQHAAKYGALISSNPFYTHVLGEQYSKVGIGPERAEEMARGKTVLDAGIKLSFHSDAPMAPARPMFLIWAAVNRFGLSGEKVLGPQERVTVEEAFRAVTIDAAYAMQREDEIGSIEIGKKANFVVFEENPLKTNPEQLKDMKILSTVYEGKAFPIKKQAKGMALLPDTGSDIWEQYALSSNHSSDCGHEHHMDACVVNQILQAYSVMLENSKQETE